MDYLRLFTDKIKVEFPWFFRVRDLIGQDPGQLDGAVMNATSNYDYNLLRRSTSFVALETEGIGSASEDQEVAVKKVSLEIYPVCLGLKLLYFRTMTRPLASTTLEMQK
jgi:hypothetical protein